MRCPQCNVDRLVTEFRSKTTGPRAGYIFPTCKVCEFDDAMEQKAAELRAVGYTCTAPVKAAIR